MTKSKKSKHLKQIDLGGDWQFRLISDSRTKGSPFPSSIKTWMKATVPGTVHTDLMAHGKIPDPFYRDNEMHVRWVADADWEYRKQFDVDKTFVDSGRIDLVCQGLDTFATIIINNQDVGSTQNMFIPHRFDVRRYLQAGRNDIRIRFESAVRRAKVLEEQYGTLPSARYSHRVHVRKAQYSFGWDWGPSLPTAGIWRPIYLESTQKIRISDVWARLMHIDDDSARVTVEFEVDRLGVQDGEYRVEIAGGGQTFGQEIVTDENRFQVSIDIPKPLLWWPNGYGEPALYEVRVTACVDGEVVDEASQKIGIRRIRLRLEDDEGKPCFRFEVNGMPVFCKGTDWIPADSFLPRVKAQDYDQLLGMARQAHMNMIRVWGGGIYEDPVFYDKCDELGLMVWQDFMFACAGYPENDGFIDNILEEARAVIRHLRNHPSIVVWCGNNENEWIWNRETGKPVEDMPGFRIFHEILPRECEEIDPSRPYWPTSPWGGDKPNSQEEGNHHAWNVWSYWDDPSEVAKNRALFITEFGFQAPADVATLEAVLQPEERMPQNRIFEFHNKQEEGTERLFRFLAGHQKITTDFEPFVYACQVNQGEALKTCVEHWRRRKFKTAGTLIWQLNDCWPAISWSLIDDEFRPKASYYYAKRFFQPLLLSFIEENGSLVLHIVNDTAHSVTGELEVCIQTFFGEKIVSRKTEIKSDPNSVSSIEIGDPKELQDINRYTSYALAKLRQDDEVHAEASYFFSRYKHLELPMEPIEGRVYLDGDGGVELELLTSGLAKSVWIHLKGWVFSENYFDLHPGEPRRIVGKKIRHSEHSLEDAVVYSVGHDAPRRIQWITPGSAFGGDMNE